MILQDLQEADTTPSDFPRARSFHWKKLRQLIEKNHPRRSLKEAQKKDGQKKPAPMKPADLTKYKGVSIKKDDAKVGVISFLSVGCFSPSRACIYPHNSTPQSTQSNRLDRCNTRLRWGKRATLRCIEPARKPVRSKATSPFSAISM